MKADILGNLYIEMKYVWFILKIQAPVNYDLYKYFLE